MKRAILIALVALGACVRAVDLTPDRDAQVLPPDGFGSGSGSGFPDAFFDQDAPFTPDAGFPGDAVVDGGLTHD